MSKERAKPEKIKRPPAKRAASQPAKIERTGTRKKKLASVTNRVATHVHHVGPQPIHLHLLSDSTGNLGNHMLTAFLTQFPRDAMKVKIRNFLNTREKLQVALDQVAAEGGVVFHAFVRSDSKSLIESACKANSIPCSDLTGDFIHFIARATGIAASGNVEVLHEVSDQYRDRIAALEFTLAHDDGLGLDTLHESDVVLTGISRTSKTPTSILLGQQGFRVGNVALAIEVAPPAQLLGMPKDKVVGLLIDPIRLLDVRQSRGRDWKMGEDRYTEIDHIEREIQWSRKLFNSRGWRTLDVTNSAIEETAARVQALAGLTIDGPTKV